jgi:SAM-dependent methyltransferase
VTVRAAWARLLEHPLVQRAVERAPRTPQPPPTAPDPESPPPAPDFSRVLGPAEPSPHGYPVTKRLYDRLTEQDVAEVMRQAAAAPELADSPAVGTDVAIRRWLVLAYGTWLKVPGVIERTGLPVDQPPDDVHAMSRGPLAAAGGLGEADMIVEAVTSAGGDLESASAVMDFGCSSGRVVRSLAAAFPHIRWLGCDPNERAIAWAGSHLNQIDFFVNPQRPPLPIADGDLDLVYAISIWSHFAPELGLAWFDEMHRVLRPGGLLAITTHGAQSVAYYAQEGLRPPEQCREILDSLYRSGFWYAPEFGKAGDFGIINPEWGTAFLSSEWLLTKLCPRWRVLEFGPGLNQRNQDVYVLQRV